MRAGPAWATHKWRPHWAVNARLSKRSSGTNTCSATESKPVINAESYPLVTVTHRTKSTYYKSEHYKIIAVFSFFHYEGKHSDALRWIWAVYVWYRWHCLPRKWCRHKVQFASQWVWYVIFAFVIKWSMNRGSITDPTATPSFWRWTPQLQLNWKLYALEDKLSQFIQQKTFIDIVSKSRFMSIIDCFTDGKVCKLQSDIGWEHLIPEIFKCLTVSSEKMTSCKPCF